MGKYYGAGGSRVGKVGAEVYEIKNGTNIVRLKNSYIPVNNAWIKREDFKKYILSLLEVGIPQIYVLDELPEKLYPYALLFVKNGEVRDIYVDKDFTRTKINIGSEEKYDAVDIVNEVPEEPRDNTVYFVNDDQVNKSKNENLDCDIYVCDNNELRKVTIKDPDVDLIKEVIEEIKTKSLANVYNANLAINEIVSTDAEGKLKASGINSTTASTVVNGVNTKSLKNIYNTTLTADRLIYSDSNGDLAASDISKTDAKDVIDGVKNNCLMDIYNKKLTANRVVSTNANGRLEASSLNINDAITIVSNIANKSLKYAYKTTLTPSRIVSTNSTGYLEASSLITNEVYDVVSNVRNKSLKNVYNKTLTANQNVVTDASGYLTTAAPAAQPHLYLHKIHYDRSGAGEINFVIYNTQSTAMSLTDIYNFLISIDCATAYKYYPVSGNMENGLVVSGIFASVYNAGSLSQREFSVVFYTGSSAYAERWIYFSGSDSEKVIQIF